MNAVFFEVVMSFDSFMRQQPKVALLGEASAMVTIIGLADWASGWELSLFVFYALPILLVAWYWSRIAGIGFAILCAAVWFWANLQINPYETMTGYTVAVLSRFAYFVFVAVGGTALCQQHEADRAHIAALERARELEGEIVSVSEHEQRRIGQDLHDGLCQFLASIGCVATLLKEDLEGKSLPEASTAAEIEGLLQDAVAEARGLARGVFPVLMDEMGLPSALEELVALVRRLQRVDVTVECADDAVVRDPVVAMHLYRIAQEALSNAVRHGKARRIAIALKRDRERITLSVKDDGEGFTAAASSGGMGLKTMAYRARLIGAQLNVESVPGKGTLVTCDFNSDNLPATNEDHGKPE